MWIFSSVVERYTAEHRGGDNGEKPEEWCVVDEFQGPFGFAIHFDLTEQEAKELAEKLNKELNKQ